MIDARLYRVFDTFGHHFHFDRVDQQKMSCNNKDGLIAWLHELHNEIDPHTREAWVANGVRFRLCGLFD